MGMLQNGVLSHIARYVKALSLAERFEFSTVAPIIDGGFGRAVRTTYPHSYDISIIAQQFGIIVVHTVKRFFGQFLESFAA